MYLFRLIVNKFYKSLFCHFLFFHITNTVHGLETQCVATLQNSSLSLVWFHKFAPVLSYGIFAKQSTLFWLQLSALLLVECVEIQYSRDKSCSFSAGKIAMIRSKETDSGICWRCFVSAAGAYLEIVSGLKQDTISTWTLLVSETKHRQQMPKPKSQINTPMAMLMRKRV